MIAALGAAVFVGLYGLKGDLTVESFLDGPGFIDEFRKTAKAIVAPKDKISPLVREAKLFALRINPPPPPKPKTPVKPKTAPTKPVARNAAIPIPKATNINTTFKVIATCRYDSSPEKSLALLEMAAEGQKWYRQGDKVGHLTINEIKDGSIVMFKNGQHNSNVDVVMPKVVSLLKSDGNTKYIPPTSSSPPVRALPTVTSRKPTPSRTPGRIPTATRSTLTRPPVPAQRTYTRPSLPTVRVPMPPIRRPATVKPPQPTPQERKNVVDENIEGIKKIMAESGPSGARTAEEIAKEQETWNQLLEMLKEERTSLDNEPAKE